ncbi:MAG: enolase C-terminal domain-like protein [Chitinophagaceae bacterium]
MKTVNDTINDSIKIEQLRTSAYKIPTDALEADGTIAWNSTTLVLVQVQAGGKTGIGYSYASEATAFFIEKELKELMLGKNALQIAEINFLLTKQIRNNGTCGITMMAISAIDNALWDLKAKIFNVPLCNLLGKAKNEMLIYGSGGFTSYNKKQLQSQFSGWKKDGMKYMKMKIGTHPENDVQRVKEAKEAIGDDANLMVDANGAYSAKQALKKAKEFEQYGVMWFEEPVRSDNLQGLNLISEHAPAQINIAAGEYGYNIHYFDAMLHANAVDILQADATRCGGITNFLKAGYLCEAHQLPFSSHCAPALHLHAAVALPSFFIAEYFHDHVRIENMLFDGVPSPIDGAIKPDESRAGFGFDFKFKDAEKYKIF